MGLLNKKTKVYTEKQKAVMREVEEKIKSLYERMKEVNEDPKQMKELARETIKQFEILKLHKCMTGKDKIQYRKLSYIIRLM